MSKLSFRAPLNWPSWVPVTPLVYRKNDRNFAPSNMKLEESIRFVRDEMEAIGASGMLGLDIDQPLNERMRKKVGSRTGAVLELDYMEQRFIIACDSWQMIEHNIYAIHLAMRQWRNMERWGIAPIAVLLQGFAVKPDQHITNKQAENNTSASNLGWMQHLGLGPTATLEDAQAVYHRRAKKSAKDPDELVKLNITMEKARAYFAQKS